MKLNLKKITFTYIYITPLLLLLFTLFIPKLKNIYIFLLTIFFFLFINMDYIKRNKSVQLIIYDTIMVLNIIYGILKTGNKMYFLEYDVMTFLLYFSFLCYWNIEGNIEKFDEYLQKNKKLPYINAFVTTLIMLFSLITGSGFVAKHQTIVFTGIYGLEHELAYHILSSYILLMYAEKNFNYKKNIMIIYKLIFAAFILLSGVRTALLALIILFLMDFRVLKLKYKILICFFAIVSAIYISNNASLLEKIPLISKSSISSEAGDVTNGRFEMSEIGMKYYFDKTTLKEKIFGITMKNIREKVFWNGLHAHNDFVNILLGYGLINLITIIILLLEYKRKYKMEFLLFILLTALFNGLFMYYELVITIPILLSLTKKGVRE